MGTDRALDCDKYALTMMQGFWKQNRHNEQVVTDGFFRKHPYKNGYSVFAGLETMIDYIQSLCFTEEDLVYLREDSLFEEEFLKELKEFRFTGDLFAAREGEIIFPNEPVFRVKTRIFESILIEAELLTRFNFQTLIATKASRIMQAAGSDQVIEMGKRRAQGTEASILGARAAYIAGFHGTSNMTAGRRYGMQTAGTMAHYWVQLHETELEAFRRYAEFYPDSCVLLVDTYDTLRSGIPNAIRVAKEMEEKGSRLAGVRIDSGDLSYLSKRARKMLDAEGLDYVKITVSSDLDETLISNLKAQGAKIDIWGVGTNVITGGNQSSLGGVYKAVAYERKGQWHPVIKVSENVEKITNPGYKKVYRLIDRNTWKARGDYICFQDETLDGTEKIKLVHPVHTFKTKTVANFIPVELLIPVFKNGDLVYSPPDVEEIREYHQAQLSLFWEEYRRRTNPEIYPVVLSDKLRELKNELLHSKVREITGEG
jgi:nicotinate phosphoribosyltransferase